MKPIVSLLLILSMLCSQFPVGTAVRTDAAVVSRAIVEGAISWGNSQMGSTAYNGYCQKFVNHCFMNAGWGGVSFVSARVCGDALITNTSVSDVPRGAVVFFDSTDHNYGHIGISLGDGTMIHAGHKGVEITNFTNASYLKSWYHIIYRGWGVWGQSKGNTLEGDTSEPAPVQTPDIQICSQLEDVGDKYRQTIANSRTETNWGCFAYINNYSGNEIGDVGIFIYDAAGNQIANKNETFLASANRMTQASVWYTLNEELGLYLTPGTTYQYKFYANVGGQYIESAIAAFTTNGTAPTPTPMPVSSSEPESTEMPQVSSEPENSSEPEMSAAPTVTPAQSAAPYRNGDVNEDGNVDLTDAQLVLKAALKIIALTERENNIADIDKNGQLTLTDAQLVLKLALRIPLIQ